MLVVLIIGAFEDSTNMASRPEGVVEPTDNGNERAIVSPIIAAAVITEMIPRTILVSRTCGHRVLQ